MLDGQVGETAAAVQHALRPAREGLRIDRQILCAPPFAPRLDFGQEDVERIAQDHHQTPRQPGWRGVEQFVDPIHIVQVGRRLLDDQHRTGLARRHEGRDEFVERHARRTIHAPRIGIPGLEDRQHVRMDAECGGDDCRARTRRGDDRHERPEPLVQKRIVRTCVTIVDQNSTRSADA